jgi:hypothetical protein
LNPSRFSYRSRQFWRTFLGPKNRIENNSLKLYLSPVQIVLFQRMQPSEQEHAVRVLEKLIASGHTEPDLLTAALLHDIGKIISPLTILDRVAIVLGKHFFPKLAKRWGEGNPSGLRRPFVVAERHAGWGADLAAQAGASGRTVDLIGRHQEPPDRLPHSHNDRLLAALQAADDSN